MADASIIVEVKGTGAKRVKRDLDDLGRSGTTAQKAIGLLKAALIGIGATQVIGGVVRTADAYTNMSNKLRVATDNQLEFTKAMESVKAISRDTFSSVEATADAYSRFELATKDLGKSQQEVADFTRAVAQTFRISGSSAQETSNAMIQLGQGLAAGALRGDEFRSVAEQNTALLNTLADRLGKTRGELKEMADNGQLTSDVLFSALIPALDQLNSQAENIAPTFEKAMGRFRDEVLLAIGESESLGTAMNALTDSVLFLADNFDMLGATLGIAASALLGYGVAMKGYAVAQGIAKGAAGAFNAVLLANPIGLLVGALAAAGAAFYIFRDDIREAALKPLGALILGVDEALKKMREFVNYIKFSFDRAVGSVLVATGQLSSADLDAILESRSQSRSFDAAQSNFGNFTTAELADAIVDLAGSGARSGGGATGGAGTASQAAGNIADATKEIKEATRAADKLVETIDDSNDRTQEFANAAGDAFDQFINGTLSAKDALRQLGQELINIARQQLFGSTGGTAGGLLSSVLGGVFGGGSSVGGLFGSQGLFNRVFSGGGGSFVGPLLPAFNNGGSMEIGGNGGIDRNLLSLNNQPIARVSSGETLDITPRGGSRGNVVVNQSINITTGVQQTVRAEIARLMPAIQQQAQKGVEEAKLRGAILV